MFFGTSTLVRSLKTGENPCEKYRVYIKVNIEDRSERAFQNYLALGQLRLHGGPRFALRGVTK